MAIAPARLVEWPLRCGPVPPLADCHSPRPETGLGRIGKLDPGDTLILVPAPGAGPSGTNPDSRGGAYRTASGQPAYPGGSGGPGHLAASGGPGRLRRPCLPGRLRRPCSPGRLRRYGQDTAGRGAGAPALGQPRGGPAGLGQGQHPERHHDRLRADPRGPGCRRSGRRPADRRAALPGLAVPDRAALAGRPRRPGRPGRPGWPVAVRARRPGRGHRPAGRHSGRAEPEDRAGPGVQHPGSPGLPDRPARH